MRDFVSVIDIRRQLVPSRMVALMERAHYLREVCFISTEFYFRR